MARSTRRQDIEDRSITVEYVGFEGTHQTIHDAKYADHDSDGVFVIVHHWNDDDELTKTSIPIDRVIKITEPLPGGE